jgi:PIN domain nuclease of toxin-antitoxin system
MGGLAGLKLLLDTHVILWCGAKPEKLPESVKKEIEHLSNELWFSPISLWEILILAEKGKIALGDDPQKAIRIIFERLPLKEAVLNKEVAIMSRQVGLQHQDPADRFLAATAMVFDLTLVTADKRLIETNEYGVLAIG